MQEPLTPDYFDLKFKDDYATYKYKHFLLEIERLSEFRFKCVITNTDTNEVKSRLSDVGLDTLNIIMLAIFEMDSEENPVVLH
jgi:FMN phosphatase YigB (HAD superfamily)